jgi:3-methyladenine DNA glycosylase AlkD
MAHATAELRSARQIVKAIKALANAQHAAVKARFFQSGPGGYAEGDRFLGQTVPQLRTLVRRCAALPVSDFETLLASPWHEVRLLALLIMVRDYRRSKTAKQRAALHACYLANTARVNNWDLVDSSAEYLVGAHLAPPARTLLDKLARSASLWERRIAMIATYAYIKRGDAVDALRLAEALLGDEHDLMHKAVGWMLREVGQRCDKTLLIGFLDDHAARMPRTALRYAIEKLPEAQRQRYLKLPRIAAPRTHAAPKANTSPSRRTRSAPAARAPARARRS